MQVDSSIPPSGTLPDVRKKGINGRKPQSTTTSQIDPFPSAGTRI